MDNNFRTLNKDIGLIQRTNNGWDLWFDKGDTVQATELHSLQVGIIIACLTSWNYMNRYGNPTYEIFGNRAYTLLKSNKSSMTAYKIQQFFIECLKRMRRVYEIVYLTVYEVPNHPYDYFVEFQVISINNQLVDGTFTINADRTKSVSYIDYEVYMPYASPTNPLTIDLWLKNEYGGGIGDELIYMYVDGEFIGVKGKTDSDGYLRATYTPTYFNHNSIIEFRFNGNVNYNPTFSKSSTFQQTPITFNVDNDGILYLVKSKDSVIDKFYLATVLEDLDNNEYYLKNEKVKWDKLYLIQNTDNTYDVYKLKIEDGEKTLTSIGEQVTLTKDTPITIGDTHLLVQTPTETYLLNIDEHLYHISQ